MTTDLEKIVEELLADHKDSDERSFLGAQFDAGLAWVHWPPGFGGLGLEPAMQEVVDDLLRRAGRQYSWLRNPMGIGMAGPAIQAHGSDEQRSRYLRPLFTSEEIWCQLFSEPGAGSDVAALSTKARHDGLGWLVDGQKVWTTSAAQAQFGLLLARSDPDVPKHSGLTAFVLDMSSPGIEVRPLRQMTGHAGEFCEVFLSGVRIPDRNRIGQPGEGWRVAITTLMNERTSIGGTVQPRGSGPIAGAVEAYRRARASDVERDTLMKLWIDAEVYRLGSLRAQQLRASGIPGPEGSVLKLGTALLAQRIAGFTTSVVGPAGMLHDYACADEEDPIFQMLWSPATTIAGGTTEIMRSIIGERVLGLPVEPRADRGRPWSETVNGA